MSNDLGNLKKNALGEIGYTKTREDLERVRVKYLGREVEINKLTAKIPTLSPDEKREFGRGVNELKKELEEAVQIKLAELLRVGSPQVDLTLPGLASEIGHLHPITQFIRRVVL